MKIHKRFFVFLALVSLRSWGATPPTVTWQPFDSLKKIWTIPANNWVRSWMGPGGNAVALLSADTSTEPAWIQILDGSDGVPLSEIRANEPLREARFSRDGRFVLAASAREVKLFEIPTRSIVASWTHASESSEVASLSAGGPSLTLFRFSADGRFAVTASDQDKRVRAYDLEKRFLQATVWEGDWAQLSPDGRYVAYRTRDDRGRETYVVRSLRTSQVVASLNNGPKGFAAPGTFAAQGYSFGVPNKDSDATILDGVDGSIRVLRTKETIRSLTFSPTGLKLAIGTVGKAPRAPESALYNVRTLRLIADLSVYFRGDSLIEPFEFSESERRLVLVSRPNPEAAERIRLIDLENPASPKLVITVAGRWPERERDAPGRRLTPDGTLLLGTRDRVPPLRDSVVPDSLLSISELPLESTPLLLGPGYDEADDREVDQYFRLLDLPKIDSDRHWLFASYSANVGAARRYLLYDRKNRQTLVEWGERKATVLSSAFLDNPKRGLLLVRREGDSTRRQMGSTTLYSYRVPDSVE